MSDPIEPEVWAGVERRLAAIEQFVPSAPPWRPADGVVPTTRLRRIQGSRAGLGSGARRETTPRLIWVFIGLGLVIAFAGAAILATAGGHPSATPARSARPALVPGFNPTGSLTSARDGHSATRLADGRVLMIGSRSGYPASAEVYDPDTGAFRQTGSPPDAFIVVSATLLQDGHVLVIRNGDTAAELYDPETGTFSPTGSMTVRRYEPAIARLLDGRVLVAGGKDHEPAGSILASAELYDPATGTFSPTGTMTSAHRGATATLLADGEVLVTGGGSADSEQQTRAELFDPTTGRFTRTGDMTTARGRHSAVLLADGRVLIVGGFQTNDTDGTILDSAEVFDPRTGTFAATGPMTTPRDWPNATTLGDGRVLISGGVAAGDAGSELFDPSTLRFVRLDQSSYVAPGATATSLADGDVLIAGGTTGDASLTMARLFHLGPAPTSTP